MADINDNINKDAAAAKALNEEKQKGLNLDKESLEVKNKTAQLQKDNIEYHQDNIIGLRNVGAELIKQSKIFTGDALTKKSINNLVSTLIRSEQSLLDITTQRLSGTRSVLDIQRDEVKNQNLINKLNTEKSFLEQRINLKMHERIGVYGKEREHVRKELEVYRLWHGRVEEITDLHKENVESLKKEEQLVRNINKTLGLGPAVLEGIDKTLRSWNRFSTVANALDISGALERTKTKMVEIQTTTGKLPGSWKSIGIVNKELGVSLSKVLTKANLTTFAMLGLVKGLLDADKAQAELQSNFNLSRSTVREIRRDWAEVSNTSDSIFVTVSSLQEAFSAIAGALGVSSNISGKILENYTTLTKQAKLSAESALRFTLLGVAQEKTADNLVESALGEVKYYNIRNKLQLNSKQILEDIAQISAGTAAVLGNQSSELAKAAASARALGMSVAQVEGMASNLLDFETSIGNELTAQLMTGLDINLSRARELALQGDIGKIAEEIANQGVSLNEFQGMNVFQAEALAKAYGTTRNELASALLNREDMIKLGAKESETAQMAFDRLRKTMTLEEVKAKLGKDALADQMAAVSNQEKFNAMLDKLMTIGIQIGDILMPAFDGLISILGIVVPIITEIFSVTFGLFRDIGKELDFITGGVDVFVPMLTLIGQAIRVGFVAPFTIVADLVKVIMNSIKTIGYFMQGDFSKIGDLWADPKNQGLVSTDALFRSGIKKVAESEDKHYNLTDSEGVKKFAKGGLVTRPTLGLVGESGPELITPLSQLKSEDILNEMREFNQNMRTLIGISEKGTKLYMNSYLVGNSLAESTVGVA